MKKDKQLKVKEETATATLHEMPVNLNDWGVPQMTARDIVIPKILAMQGMSKAVADGVAKMGEFRESLNLRVLGDLTTPIEIVPFYLEKVFVVVREEAGQFKFNRIVPIAAENEGHEFECVDPESKAREKWYRTMNYYVLLPSEIEDGSAIPYLLSFRSSSARAGQKLATTMYMKNLKAGKTPASMVVELSGSKQKNTKGTFVVMDISEKRPSTPREVQEAFNWLKAVRSGGVQVDHSDVAEEVQPVVTPETDEY